MMWKVCLVHLHYYDIDFNYHIFSLKPDYDFFSTFYFQRNKMKGNIQTTKLNFRTEIEYLELWNGSYVMLATIRTLIYALGKMEDPSGVLQILSAIGWKRW